MFAFLLLVHGCRGVGAVLSVFRGRSALKGVRVLAIGTFYHKNWYESHLAPLASADMVDALYVVSGESGIRMKGVTWCVAPTWLRSILRMHGARFVWSMVTAMRRRPDVIVGYFVFPSALWALALSRLIGAKSVYQMCGGPREFTRCGADSGNAMLKYMLPGFPLLERILYAAIAQFDLIIVRGARAEAFCREHFPSTPVSVITGAIDQERFNPTQNGVDVRFDVMTVCRLAPVKRLEMLLEALAKVVDKRPKTHAVIVGDGPARAELEALAKRLRLTEHVSFVGTQDEVERFHHQSRLYVMTSRDEGLSIALAEAMASGLPAVVTDVGELGELVRDGRNGYLVPSGDADTLAERLLSLLNEDEQRQSMAKRAAEDAFSTCGLPHVADRWNKALMGLAG